MIVLNPLLWLASVVILASGADQLFISQHTYSSCSAVALKRSHISQPHHCPLRNWFPGNLSSTVSMTSWEISCSCAYLPYQNNLYRIILIKNIFMKLFCDSMDIGESQIMVLYANCDLYLVLSLFDAMQEWTLWNDYPFGPSPLHQRPNILNMFRISLTREFTSRLHKYTYQSIVHP